MLNAHSLHRRAARVLPSAIQTCGILQDDLPPSVLSALLFPLRRESSGLVVFRIAEPTIEAMTHDPVGLLEHATQARECLSRHRPPFAYRPWRRTWIPESWVCALSDQCAGPAGSEQAWFTVKTDGKALLVLVPERRLAAYLWND